MELYLKFVGVYVVLLMNTATENGIYLSLERWTIVNTHHTVFSTPYTANNIGHEKNHCKC